MAHNLGVIKAAAAAKAAGPQPDGEGYSLEELAEAGGTRSVVSDGEPGAESAVEDAFSFAELAGV